MNPSCNRKSRNGNPSPTAGRRLSLFLSQWADDATRIAHIEVDVWVILRARYSPNALKLARKQRGSIEALSDFHCETSDNFAICSNSI